MATSFGALCTDFYVNLRMGLRLDLPTGRESVLGFFDRVRAEIPAMDRFRVYSDEVTLESARRDVEFQWIGMRKNVIRCGHVNPDNMEAAYNPHRQVMRLCPYYLSVSPLDIEYIEMLWAFDVDCKANHNQVIFNALYSNSPLAALAGEFTSRILDLQPTFGISLDENCRLQAIYEVKTSTTREEIRSGDFRGDAISVLLTLRKNNPVKKAEELPDLLESFRIQGEELVTSKLLPELLTPINRVIASSI